MHANHATLKAFASGELGEEQVRSLQKHLSACEECSTALRAIAASKKSAAPGEFDSVDVSGIDQTPATPNDGDDTVTYPPRHQVAAGQRGQLFGDYELLQAIARGGMGVVWKARQTKLNRLVAVKMILSGQLASTADVQRFYQEAEAAAKLDHPGIVPIYEVGQVQGQHFYSMGLVEGKSLTAHLAGGPMSSQAAATMMEKIAVAIAYAHSQGVIHRDLKPANVLVDKKGLPRVTDFGLAKHLDRADGLTQTGDVIGTPSYMPPEQARGDIARLGPQADIYSLGATLYALLTARPPFQSSSTAETLLQVLNRDPVAPRQLNASVHHDLETICLKCLEKEPERRYASAEAFADELRRFQRGEPILARPINAADRAWRWCRRNAVVAALSTAVVVVLLLGILISSIFRQQATIASREAKGLGTKVGELGQQVATEKEKRGESDAQANLAARERLHQEYIAEMRLLPTLWRDSKVDLLRERLKRYENIKESSPGIDPRGIEWHYWNRKVNSAATSWQAKERIISLAWSPTGKTLYATDASGQLTAWDRATAKTRVIAGPDSKSMIVVASPVNDDLAIVTQTRSVNVKQGDSTLVAFRAQPLWDYECVAFGPNGKQLVAGTQLGVALPLFDLEERKRGLDLMDNPRSRRNPQVGSQRLDVHEREVVSVAFSPKEKFVASGGEDGRIGIWNTDGNFDRWLEGHHGRVVSLAFSSDGTKLISRSIPRIEGGRLNPNPAAGEVIVWDFFAGTVLRKILVNGSQPSALIRAGEIMLSGGNFRAEFCHGDREIIYCEGQVAKVYDYVAGQATAELKGHSAPITTLRYSQQSDLLATGDERGEVRITPVSGVDDEEVALQFESPARVACCSVGGTRLGLLSGGVNFDTSGVETPGFMKYASTIALADLKSSKPAQESSESYHGIAVSPSGKLAASLISIDRSAKEGVAVWDESSGKMLHEIQPLTAPELLKPNRFTRLVCLAFRSDDELYVAGEGILVLVDLKTSKSTVVAGLEMGPPPTSERERFAVDSNTVMTLAFSSDQRLAACGLAKGDIVIRDVTKNWEIITTLRGHTRGVTSLAFSSDGQRLASCSGRYFIWHFLEPDNRPGEVMLWDTATWQSPLTLLRRQDSEFLGVGFANEDRTLYAVANRLDPRASSLPVGELVRWDTREHVPDPQATDKPAVAPPKHADFLSVGFGLNGYQMCGCTSIAIHPNGQLVAGFTVKGQLMLWNASTGETVSSLQSDEDLGYPFGQMQFSENGSQLLYYKANRLGKNMVGEYTVPQLQLSRNREALPEELFLFPLQRLPPSALSADRSWRVKAIQKEQKLEVVNVTDKQVEFSVPFEDQVTECGFARDGKTCFVLSILKEDSETPAGKPLRIQRWSVPDGKPLPVIEGLAYPAAVSPDMDYAVSMLETDKYFAVELATGKRSAEPVALEQGLRGMLFFPNGQRFATYGNSTGIHLWNLSTPSKCP